MRLLIDECLHTSLVGVAHAAGHSCEHVNFLGLSGYQDWRLMQVIRAEEYTFVTNNRLDFVRLYAREELHAGLIIVLDNVPPARQRHLFSAALIHIGTRDFTKTLLEVNLIGSVAVCREYSDAP